MSVSESCAVCHSSICLFVPILFGFVPWLGGYNNLQSGIMVSPAFALCAKDCFFLLSCKFENYFIWF